ncbi:hypothetical protein DMB66_29570 [Actinoplanes sp. ATCC 53533]|nr:hypothetical protein DMB66_29570 [Actinoplanes sp. ATCC 53533]
MRITGTEVRPVLTGTGLTGTGAADRFAAVFDEHAGGLWRYLARQAGAAVAEDLVAETFLVAWEARDDYVAELGSVRSWRYGITWYPGRHRGEQPQGRDRAVRAAADGAAGAVRGLVRGPVRPRRRLAVAERRLPRGPAARPSRAVHRRAETALRADGRDAAGHADRVDLGQVRDQPGRGRAPRRLIRAAARPGQAAS